MPPAGPPPVQRLRITFAVAGPARYAPHLDVTRAWVRALRRLGLPLAYSHGFHPHPRVSLAAPLPVGYAAEREVLDIYLDAPVAPEELAARLRGALPEGLTVRGVEVAPMQAPPLPSQVVAADYTVSLPGAPPDLRERVERLMAAESLPFTRARRDREVRFDLRPRILRAGVQECDGQVVLSLRLAHGPGGAARPEDVVAALGLEWAGAQATRTGLVFA
ncbi:MAG: TIGR03936 family radical SAM-associated protein [Anaerolineae bacterium]|nr:TIGR03936 family radical SAM-associated protein [Anaerolineae bacterium]